MKRTPLALGPTLALLLTDPVHAKQLCCGKKVAMTFGDAAPEVQLLSVLLWGAALASVVVWALALRRLRRAPGDRAIRTMAFLDAWRAGGPLLALGGAGYLMVNFFVAVYAYEPVSRYQEYAPGFAEAAMILWAGFQAGGVAALVRAHLNGRLQLAAG